jgi:Xaa-Pro aminopeptidase
MARMDISVRYHGYWCDCTNTVVLGAIPTDEQRRIFKIVREAYEVARSKLVHGNRLCDVSAAEADCYRRYGMEPQVYTGHQIGCGVNEEPRIVCYEDEIIEPGMVVCIEPQQYGSQGGGIGVRLEKVISITEGGPVELNTFEWGICC